MTAARTNWAGNVRFGAARLHRPSTLDELRRLVAGSSRIRALGTAHSFSTLADSAGDQVSVAGLPATTDIDLDRGTVTASAGMRYGELAVLLQREGHALANLGSLPHLSVAGACATGTHGSGDRNGSLSSAVAELEMVTATGDVVTLSRDDDGDKFDGAIVALGALGVVTRLTLDMVPSYDVVQLVDDDLPREALDEHLGDIFASAYSVSLFTHWQSHIAQVWRKHRLEDGEPHLSRWGATPAEGPRHPIAGMATENCTPQQGAPGPWHERLPHFRLAFTPSAGDELQSEYLVSRADAVEALAALDRVRDQFTAVLMVSELRTVAADNLWLSPSYLRDSLAVHCTWVKDPPRVRDAVAAIEDALAPYDARPHWGKVFGTDATTLARLYERLPDFRALVRRYDPDGVFGNDLLDRWLS